MVLVLVTLLAATPPAPPNVQGATRALRLRVDLGGLLGASWFVKPGRAKIEAAVLNAGAALRGDDAFDGDGLLLAAPAVGPLLLAARQGKLDVEDRALLISSGMLQLVGLSLGATALARGESLLSSGCVLSFSPIAGGRLGLSVRLTGF